MATSMYGLSASDFISKQKSAGSLCWTVRFPAKWSYFPSSLLVLSQTDTSHTADISLYISVYVYFLVISKSFLKKIKHGSVFNTACNNPFSLLHSTTTSSWIRLQISHHPLSWFSRCHFRRSSESDLASIISLVFPPPLLEETSKYHSENISSVIDWVAPHHRPRYFKVSGFRFGVGWLRQGGVWGGNLTPWGSCRGRAAEHLWLASKSWVWSRGAS